MPKQLKLNEPFNLILHRKESNFDRACEEATESAKYELDMCDVYADAIEGSPAVREVVITFEGYKQTRCPYDGVEHEYHFSVIAKG